MSGISSSTGLISGINTDQIIAQLLQIEGRPKALAQARIVELQGVQAIYLDLNGKLSALKTAAAKFRSSKVFETAKLNSSNAEVLTGSASPGAAQGSFNFLVSRVVSTQQSLSRGFTDRDSTGVGVTKVIVEPEQARLDRNIALSELNGGLGANRGKVEVLDSAGNRAVIDLSRVANTGEVLDAFNSATGVKVNASVEGGHLVLTDAAGGAGTLTVTNVTGYDTATSLGIAGTATGGKITGADIYYLGNATALGTIRDGLGIGFNKAAGTGVTADFSITTGDGVVHQVDIGDVWALVDNKLTKTKSAVANVEQLKARIAEQTGNAVRLDVSPDGRGFTLVDLTGGAGGLTVAANSSSTAAADLGITGTTAGASLVGRRVLSGLNSTLTTGLGGGSGLEAVDVSITARDGTVFSFNVGADTSVTELLASIGTATGGAVTAKLGDNGTSIVLTDTTGGVGNLIVQGGGAEQLGINTAPAGVASATVKGTRLQRRYINENTLLSTLNSGAGLGTGEFTLIGANGASAPINIGTDARTIGDIIEEINATDTGVRARINDRGDGILIEKDPDYTGTAQKIKITDVTGTVAKSLNLVGEGADTGAGNIIDGSYERTITLTGTETLEKIAEKINETAPRVRASIINDGTGGTPFRLRLTATLTGEAGRFLFDTEGTDLGLTTLTRGDNARLLFGADDPAKAVLVSSTTNSFSSIVEGVTVTAQRASDDPVDITIGRNVEEMEKSVNDFITAFNAVISRIDNSSRYNAETQTAGPLLGDSASQQIRQTLFNGIIRRPVGLSGNYTSFASVGIKTVTGGKLELDSTKFRAALEADPEGVRDLFAASVEKVNEDEDEDGFVPVEGFEGVRVRNTGAGEFSRRGVAELLVAAIDGFIDRGDGFLTRANESLTNQITLQRNRIKDMDKRLESKRLKLTTEFATLESTLARLQGQQSALAGLSGLVGRR